MSKSLIQVARNLRPGSIVLKQDETSHIVLSLPEVLFDTLYIKECSILQVAGLQVGVVKVSTQWLLRKSGVQLKDADYVAFV